MKKMFGKVAIFMLVASLLAFTGCNQAGLPAGQSPEDVITAALLNQEEITESVYEITAKADLAGDVEGEQTDFDFNLNIDGSVNSADSSVLMNLLFDSDLNEERVDLDLEVRVNENGVFFRLAKFKVSNQEDQENLDLRLEKYSGKWVKDLSSQSAGVTALALMVLKQSDYKEGDPLPYKNIEYVGTTNVLGLNSYHFVVDLDSESIFPALNDIFSFKVDSFLNAATIKGDVYVAVDERVITGFGGNMKLDDPEMNGTVEIQVKLNPTRSNKVDTPTAEVELTAMEMSELVSGINPQARSEELDEEVMTDAEFEAMMAEFDEMQVPEDDVVYDAGMIPKEDLQGMLTEDEYEKLVEDMNEVPE